MKPEILMIARAMPSVMEALEAAYTVHRLWEAPNRTEFLATVAKNARAICTNGGVGASGEIIDALPQLEIIACYGVGVDAIDLPRAKQRGIPVTTTPDVLTADVADLAVALMLTTTRRVVRGDTYVRSLEWANLGEMPLTRTMSGKKVGIVGLGRVGQAVAKRLSAFDMQVSYTSRSTKPELSYPFVADLLELATSSDFLVITAAGGSSSRHLVNQAVLEALGPQGILVNVARGSVVDEVALVAALESGKLGGAGLDVFANEPHVPAALLKLDQVVLMPHHASGTLETRTAMGDLVIANLAAHFAGQPLITPYPN